jgi:hypothetical protein
MRVRALYAVPVLLCSFLFAATAHSQLRKIYLQPKTTAREKQSTFVDSIRFIPLEAKKDIELGIYTNAVITDKYLMVIDQMNKRIVFYTKAGKFVKVVVYKKLGGDFYPSYREYSNQISFFGGNKNYSITPKDRILIKEDWSNPRNKKYFKKYSIDLNDTLLTIKKQTPEESDIISSYHYYDDYKLASQIVTSPLYKDSLDYEMKLYKDNRLVKGFFPYNRVNEPRFLYDNFSGDFFKTDTPYIRMVSRPLCDTIYKLVKDSISPIYQLVLPLENSLPASFYTKPFKNKVERENFSRNNGWMFNQLYNLYETKRLLYLAVGYLSNYDTYLYDKQRDAIYKTKNIKADSSQFNLELLTEFSSEYQGGRYYKTIKASDLLPFFEKNKDAIVPRELEAFIKSKPPESTPVIVEFKLKN